MTGALTRDYRAFAELAAAIVESMTSEDHDFVVAAQLNECLRGTATIFMGDFRPATATARTVAWAPEALSRISWDARMRECGDSHPLARVYARERHPTPLTVTEVVDERAWRANPTYRTTRRELDGSTRHLAVPLPSAPGIATAFIVCRPAPDFGDRERDLARALQPLLVAAARQARELRRLTRRHRAVAIDLGLTPRELTVLSLTADGLTAATTARRLGISVHTVNKHLENAYRKCGTHDRLSTVLLLREADLIT